MRAHGSLVDNFTNMLASHTSAANANNTHRYDAAGCVDQLQLFVRLIDAS